VGDRFYLAQLEATGNCPGATQSQTRRKRKMAWTDEQKAEVIEAYEAGNPTPENSMEIVAEIAEQFEQSPNGVRMVLTKAGVYVKKSHASGGTSKASGAATSRVSKAAAIESLTAALTDAGQEVDEEIVSKLTGKAAMYFAGVIAAVNS
jgi:nanoRNase/pAp phosphatase (c-di-AMP/oligoRNAs hydrolase)